MRYSKILAMALLLGCTQSLLFGAADLKSAKDSIVSMKKYDEAVEAFNKREYENAYKKFLALFEEKPDDSRINFYLGRAALETKRYDEALSAFERVLIVEPNHIRSRLEIAKVYFEEKEFGSAEAEFKTALEYELPEQVKKQIQSYLAAIEMGKKKHFINGSFVLGATLDTNVNNGIGNKDFSIASGQTLPGDDRKKDISGTAAFSLSHIYDFGDSGGWYWQDGGTVYTQLYKQEAGSNVRYLALNTGPGYRSQNVDFGLLATYDALNYSQNSYFNSIGLSPKATYRFPNNYALDGAVSIKKKFYPYEKWNRASLYEDLSLTFKKGYAATGAIASVGVVLSKEFETYNENSVGAGAVGRTDISNTSKTLRLEYYRPLLAGLDAVISGSMRQSVYPETDLLFNAPKKETNKSFGAALYKTIFKSSVLGASYGYSKNESNFDNLNYSKHTFGLNYIYNFLSKPPRAAWPSSTPASWTAPAMKCTPPCRLAP